ncbi:MAG TPA: hypothetical protein VFH45_01060, partial [Acidimicrobiales bacterium]|nr:hypothetical protein [Acidimicrobiales bacterium]
GPDRRPDRAAGGDRDRERPRRPDRERAPGDGRGDGRATGTRRPGAGGGERTRPPRPEAPARPAPKRLTPGTKHRDAMLEELPVEQRPVAEQLVRGGIPAVRQAIAAEGEKAKAEGRPPINPEPLIAMAETLLPTVKAAVWRDRAEAATQIIDDVGLRDLRSVVAGADAARDEEGRALARTLREALERRLDEQRQSWIKDITTNLDEGRVVRALRLSARPPDAAIRFPAELAMKLAETAGAAMTADTPPDRWLALLDAVSASPVRRSVKPAALPSEQTEELMQGARQLAGRVPAVAPMLGLTMPPPPGPAPTAARRPAPPRQAPRRERPPAPKQESAPASEAPPAEPPPASDEAPVAPAPEPEVSAETAAPAAEPAEAEPVTEPGGPAGTLSE